MPRPEKVQAVEEIKDRLENSEATFLAEYRGLSVKQQQSLRRGLRDAGAEFKVVKMTLARRAAKELGIDFGVDLTGPTALAFASGDPVPVAKALRDFGKENDAFVLKSGLFGGNVLPPEQVTKLADIEPREVLLAKIAGAAKAPLYSLAGMLSSFTRDAASMFSQLLEKREADAPAAPVAAPEEDVAPEDVAPEDAAPEEGAVDAPSEEAVAPEAEVAEAAAPEAEVPEEAETAEESDEAPEAAAEGDDAPAAQATEAEATEAASDEETTQEPEPAEASSEPETAEAADGPAEDADATEEE